MIENIKKKTFAILMAQMEREMLSKEADKMSAGIPVCQQSQESFWGLDKGASTEVLMSWAIHQDFHSH